MTLTDIRTHLVTALESWKASQTNLPVFYENTTEVDINTVAPTFIKANVKISATKKKHIGNPRRSRAYGTLELVIFHRLGQGTLKILQVAESLRDTFENTTTNQIHLEGLDIEDEVPLGEFIYCVVKIPFYTADN
jgi:hypothetical protein